MSLACINLEKRFSKKMLYEQVNVRFEPGQCHCLMGENGSGKTTLLKMMAGLIPPDKGQVVAEGLCAYAGVKDYIFQGSVEDNLLFPLTLKRQKKRGKGRSLEDILALFHLEALREQKATTLSSGETQRLILGRAFIWEPEILLLDEPTSNLDWKMTLRIEEVIRQYAQNHTVVVVSHERDQVDRLEATLWRIADKGIHLGGD